MKFKTHQGPLLLAALLAISTASVGYASEILERQREAFRDVFPAAERGDWGPAKQQELLLARYILWPDLRAAYLRARLGEPSEEAAVREFIEEYQGLKPARELRYLYALELAKSGRYADYLTLYRRHYRNLGVARLDCLALRAEIEIGPDDRLIDRARPLWLVDRSQHDECDPVFEHLRETGDLDSALYRQRYELTIEGGNFRLARYLARSIDETVLAEANRWVTARENPDRFLADTSNHRADRTYQSQLAYAVKQIAYDDPEKAAAAWYALGRHLRFAVDTRDDVERHIALWAARLNSPQARRLLAALPRGAVDDEVRRWRTRTALRAEDWASVTTEIDLLPEAERRQDQWQYWRAVALDELGAKAEAMLTLTKLARERSYYGFLAADRLDLPYAYSHDEIEPDDQTLARLASDPALVRARELFLVGLDGRGRSEWDAAVAALKEEEIPQAALLAHRWGWHSRAIATAAKTGHYDDLELRYPLPYRRAFRNFASDSGIGESWAYGIARSESLFMRDIRSGAGAIGLMQLLPETGRRSAREIKLPYSGWDTLVDPDSNIRLGTYYLGKIYRRFDGNMALATAAYNAGPLRVEQWLPSEGEIDARIWIENIPFNETRNYVRRVLASEIIFHWRMGGERGRVSDRLAAVVKPASPEQTLEF